MTEFTKEKIVKDYYTFADVATRIGGLKAVIMPFLNWFTLILNVWFLYLLGVIINKKKIDGEVEECQ